MLTGPDSKIILVKCETERIPSLVEQGCLIPMIILLQLQLDCKQQRRDLL